MPEIYWLRGEPVTIVSRFSDSCTIKFNDGTTALINPIILNNTPPPIDEMAEFKSTVQSLRRFLYKVAGENLASQFRFEEIVSRIDKLTDLILDLGGGNVTAADIGFTSTDNISANNVQTAIAELDAEAVHLAGAETIAGAKTLTSDLILPNVAWNGPVFSLAGYRFWIDGSGLLRFKNGTPATISDGSIIGPVSAANLAFTPTGNIAANTVQTAIAELDSEAVHLAGAETIAGAKTFTSPIRTTNTTASTNTATGSGIFGGGIGAGGDINVGGNISAGGNISSPSSAWNAGRLVLGTYNLWVDGNGLLRVKNGAPTSATDGTPVAISAANVPFAPAGTIAASDVQSAIAEAASEALQKSSNLNDLASASTAYANLGAAQSLAPNGWTKLPNGLILQWTTYTTPAQVFNANTIYSFTAIFPVTFNTVYSCVGSFATPVGSQVSTALDTLSTSSITARIVYSYTTASTTATFRIFAIGI